MIRKTAGFGLSLILATLLFPVLTWAYVGLCCAHCGGNMPLNIPGGGIPETHEFRFKVSQSYMEMGSMRDTTDDISTSSLLGNPATGKFAAVPDEMRMYMTMFGAAYSFTDDFALMIMGNYVRNEMDMKFNTLLTNNSGRDGFTMFSDGFGDTKLLGKLRMYKDDNLAPKMQFSAIFGMSLPTGETDKEFTENPVAGQNGTILPFRMQTSSGTVDPIMGFTFQMIRDPWWMGANIMYEGHWYDNARGYHQGQELWIDGYIMRQVHQRLVLQAQLNYKHEGRYSDEPYEGRVKGHGHTMFNPNNPFTSPLFDPENYGGEKLSLSFGFQVQPFNMHVIEVLATLPIYQNLNGPQLRDSFRIMASYYLELPTKRSRRYVGTKAPKELGF